MPPSARPASAFVAVFLGLFVLIRNRFRVQASSKYPPSVEALLGRLPVDLRTRFSQAVNSVQLLPGDRMPPFIVAQTVGQDITINEAILVGDYAFPLATLVHEMLHCEIPGGTDDHEWIYRETVRLTAFDPAVQAYAQKELDKFLRGAYYDPNEVR